MAVRNWINGALPMIYRAPPDEGGGGGGSDAGNGNGMPGQGEGTKVTTQQTPIDNGSGAEGSGAEGDELGFASEAGADGADKGGQSDEAFSGGDDDAGDGKSGDQPGDKKSDDKGKDSDAASDKEGKKSEGAPEKYEDFSLPEGVEAHEGLMTDFQAECKELGLTQTEAQSRLDGMLAWKAKADAQALEYWQEQAASWTQAAKAQGVMTSEMRQRAAAGLRLADNVELEGGEKSTTNIGKTLAQMGLDKNPAIIRAFAAYHELHGDETDVVQAGQPGGAELTADEKLYGKGASQT